MAMRLIIITLLTTTQLLLCEAGHPRPKCDDPKATQQPCATVCPPTCENPTPTCTRNCLVNGCVCNPGYVLDAPGGKCILISECPDDASCGGDPNARITDCGSNCPPTCEESDQACAAVCVSPSCKCREGFTLSRAAGKCVPDSQCRHPRSKCDDPNATQQPCATVCPPTCENPTPTCTRNCLVNGCVCNPGYVLDAPGGKCIPISECPDDASCGGDPNARITDCGSNCPPTCEGSDQSCAAVCVSPSCKCREGFTLSRAAGKCVPDSQCRKCKKNERWVDCVLGECITKTCKESGNPIACPRIAGRCEGGCICKEGYLRNEKHVCIPRGQCSTCGGSRNATAGCGTHCGNLCSNYKYKSLILCEDICYDNACDCKEGYAYNDIINRCVLEKDCPIPCNGDPYAVSKPCASARRPTCDDPEEYEEDDDTCVKDGCECVSGYVLDGDRCIKRELCPKNENNDENSDDPEIEDEGGEDENKCD